MKPRTVSMLGFVNWASTRVNLEVCEHQGADQPVHQQSDQHLCYSFIGKHRVQDLLLLNTLISNYLFHHSMF